MTEKTIPQSSLYHVIRALLMCAASCQGGHSDAGAAVAEILGIPFPLRMEDLERAAIGLGFNPRELWPWLYRQRAMEKK